jgi:hypothetical protein
MFRCSVYVRPQPQKVCAFLCQSAEKADREKVETRCTCQTRTAATTTDPVDPGCRPAAAWSARSRADTDTGIVAAASIYHLALQRQFGWRRWWPCGLPCLVCSQLQSVLCCPLSWPWRLRAAHPAPVASCPGRAQPPRWSRATRLFCGGTAPSNQVNPVLGPPQFSPLSSHSTGAPNRPLVTAMCHACPCGRGRRARCE